MKKSRSLLLLLTIIGCHTICFAQTQNTAAFQGKVYAAEFGALLSNIRIQVMRDSKIIQTALSNEDGNYQVGGLVPGRYTIVIEEKGFVHRQLQVDLKAEHSLAVDIDVQVTDIGTYSVEPKDEVKGEVKQTKGGPVEGATVNVVDPFTARLVAQAKTNAKGEYRVAAKQGQFVIFVSRPGYLAKSVTVLLRVTTPEDKRKIDFMLDSYDAK